MRYACIRTKILTICSTSLVQINRLHVCNDDVSKLKHFPRYWPFLQRIHRSPVNSPHIQRPVTLSFDVFFDLSLNKRLSKQSRRCWFETGLRSLWRDCNVTWIYKYIYKYNYLTTTLLFPYFKTAGLKAIMQWVIFQPYHLNNTYSAALYHFVIQIVVMNTITISLHLERDFITGHTQSMW